LEIWGVKNMREKITIILLVLCFTASYIGIAEEHVEKEDMKTFLKEMEKYIVNGFNDNYGLKLEMNHGSNPMYAARYEGPQPIGDCYNDGKNEV